MKLSIGNNGLKRLNKKNINVSVYEPAVIIFLSPFLLLITRELTSIETHSRYRKNFFRCR